MSSPNLVLGISPTTNSPSPDPATPSASTDEGVLLRAKQMENVGLLAAGVAHDLNNLLSVILGSAELAGDMIPPHSPARCHLVRIESTVRRAGELCRTMLACARTDEKKLEWIDANALARDTVALLQTSRLASHRVRLDLARDATVIPAAPAQFRQIILNLLLNAADACGARGGKISVSTRRTRLDTRQIAALRPAVDAPGEFLRLRVADNGCGMDEAMVAKLFAPFQSSKAAGRGLGLASLYEITRRHHGGLRVFSEPARGTIFDVFLPTTTTETPALPTESPPREGRNRRPTTATWSARVLIADDEDTLRSSLSTFLTGRGCTVTAVNNGEAAVRHLAAHPEADLILIDVLMPGLSGSDALAAVRAAGNRVPAIVMTGNSSPEITELFAPLKPALVLTKPFTLDELEDAMRQLLPKAG